MKLIFSTGSSDRLNDLWLLIFRVILSVFMLTHGLPKLAKLIEGNGGNFPDPIGIGNNLSIVLAVIGEVVGYLARLPFSNPRLITELM